MTAQSNPTTNQLGTSSKKLVIGSLVVMVMAVVGIFLPSGSQNLLGTSVAEAASSSLASQFTYLKSATTPTGLDPNFSTQVNDCVIPTATAYGYDLYIAAGFRTLAAQDALYDQGRTVDGDIVTNAQGGQSMHNFGFAVDLADHINGENIDYGVLGNIAAWCGLEHGDRGYTDLSHFEYRGGLSIEEFAAGMRPAPLTLPCQLLAIRAGENQPVTLSDLNSCGAPDFNTETPIQSSTNGGSQD